MKKSKRKQKLRASNNTVLDFSEVILNEFADSLADKNEGIYTGIDCDKAFRKFSIKTLAHLEKEFPQLAPSFEIDKATATQKELDDTLNQFIDAVEEIDPSYQVHLT